tara:strand:- start:1970 stop:2863 length:894 start_codon:yes stop_codon:yes gene_type:complete
MATNFLQNSPVGTRVYDRKTKQYYVKINRDGRIYWKKHFGSGAYSLLISDRDHTKDEVGKIATTVRGDEVHQADTVPDYMQGKGFWQSDKYFTKKNNYIIKDGKYFLPNGTEITNHKFTKGSTYHIDNFDNEVGKGINNDISDTQDFLKWRKRKREHDLILYNLNTWKKKGEKEGIDSKAYNDGTDRTIGDLITNWETQLNTFGTVEPWIAPSKRDTNNQETGDTTSPGTLKPRIKEPIKTNQDLLNLMVQKPQINPRHQTNLNLIASNPNADTFTKNLAADLTKEIANFNSGGILT